MGTSSCNLVGFKLVWVSYPGLSRNYPGNKEGGMCVFVAEGEKKAFQAKKAALSTRKYMRLGRTR